MEDKESWVLEVLNGPEDGLQINLSNPRFLLGPVEGAALRLDYDPLVPPEGVEIQLGEEGVKVAGEAKVNYGETFEVGQVKLRILREEGSDVEPSRGS